MSTIVLAAGRSQRFGWANKLLASTGGRPLIVITLTRVLGATRGPIILVSDHQAHALRATLKRHGVVSNRLHIVHAFGSRHDMARSRRTGLAAAPRLSSALQIHLADVPGIDARLITRLRYAIHCGARAARPVYDGQPGHPVRFRRARLNDDAAAWRQARTEVPATGWQRIPGPPGCVRDVDHRQMIRNLNWK